MTEKLSQKACTTKTPKNNLGRATEKGETREIRVEREQRRVRTENEESED